MIKIINKNIKEKKHVFIDKAAYIEMVHIHNEAFIGRFIPMNIPEHSLWLVMDECLINPEYRMVLSLKNNEKYEFHIDHFVNIDIMIDHKEISMDEVFNSIEKKKIFTEEKIHNILKDYSIEKIKEKLPEEQMPDIIKDFSKRKKNCLKRFQQMTTGKISKDSKIWIINKSGKDYSIEPIEGFSTEEEAKDAVCRGYSGYYHMSDQMKE